MKLSVRALTIVFALLWGGAVLLVGLVNLAWPSYGSEFLQMVSSIYPGFDASRSVGDVFVGTIYALVDGALCGFLIAWLYNAFAGAEARAVVR